MIATMRSLLFKAEDQLWLSKLKTEFLDKERAFVADSMLIRKTVNHLFFIV